MSLEYQLQAHGEDAMVALGKQSKMRRSRLRARPAQPTSERKRVRLASSSPQTSLAQTSKHGSSRATWIAA